MALTAAAARARAAQASYVAWAPRARQMLTWRSACCSAVAEVGEELHPRGPEQELRERQHADPRQDGEGRTLGHSTTLRICVPTATVSPRSVVHVTFANVFSAFSSRPTISYVTVTVSPM